MDKLARFRVSAADLKWLQRAADLDGRKLSDWCRHRLLLCARVELGGTPHEDDRRSGSSDQVLAKKSAKAARKASAKKGKCEARELLSTLKATGLSEARPSDTVRREAVPKPEWKK